MAGFTISKGLPGIGASLGEGLEILAKHKLGQILDRRQQKRVEEDLERVGFKPEAARLLSHESPEIRQKYIQHGGEGLYRQQPSQEEVQQNRTQEAQAQAYTPQEQQAVGLQDLMQSINPRAQGEQQLNRLTGGSGGAGANYLQGLLNPQRQTQQPQLGQQGSTQAQAMQPQNLVAPQQQQQAPIAQPSHRKNMSVAEALTRGSTESKAATAERNAELKNQLAINKEGRAIAEGFSNFGAAAQDIKKQIPNLKKVILSGEGGNKVWNGLVGLGKKVGLNLSSTLAPGAAKVAASKAIFFPLISKILKDNFTDQEFKAFEEKLPHEADSDEIQLYKLDNLMPILDTAIRRAEASEELSNKYNGKFTSNFSKEVYERADRHSAKSKNPEISLLPDPSTESPDSSFELSNGEIAKIVDGQWRIV